MTGSENFKIILLTNDDRQQGRFKEIFKKVGVEAIITQELDQFWHTVNVEEADLCLVDVRQMSSGNRTLKNHPRVINNDLPLAFFYSNTSQALVYSTYDFAHNGLINSSMSLAGQLKSILLRVENNQSVQNTIKGYIYDKEKAEKTSRKFITENEQLKQKAFYHGLLETVSAEMKDIWKGVDFYQAVNEYFESINFIKKNTFFLLNNSGNKLISPTYDNNKYEKLPSIWMDKSCDSGIHLVGQNKATQITLDLWGAQFVQLQFFDSYDNPVALAYLEVEEEFIEKFNWVELEGRLNNQFSRHLLSRRAGEISINNELNSFEFFEYIRKKNSNLNKDFQIIKEVNFEKIFSKAIAKNSIDFSWNNFAQEYFKTLAANFSFDYKVCYYSGEKVYFIIAESETDEFDFEVKNYNKKFPFWRYFEAPDQMVISDLAPSLRSVPFSTVAFIKSEEVENRAEKKSSVNVAPEQINSKQKRFQNRPPMTM